MNGLNHDAPCFEAVSLCVKNDSMEWWRQWTRIADIKDEQLYECSFNADSQENTNEQKYAFSNRSVLPNKVRQSFEKGDLAIFSWSDAPDPERPNKIRTSITLLSQLPLMIVPLQVNTADQAITLLHNGVLFGSTKYDVIYTLAPTTTGTQLGLLCNAEDMERQNGKYRLRAPNKT